MARLPRAVFPGLPHHVTQRGNRRQPTFRRYTSEINERYGWRGRLWQDRFSSYVMDEPHLVQAVRYIELNPVRAGLVASAEQYPWSSARAHLAGRDDVLVRVAPMLERVPDWRVFLGTKGDVDAALRAHQTTGRPLGSDAFVGELERRAGRPLRPLKGGRRPAGHPTKICMVSPDFSLGSSPAMGGGLLLPPRSGR